MRLEIKIAIVVIVFLASFLRLYKLDQVPPSLNWDEAAAGYNAFAIANFGRDEWGENFPLVFTSFRDDKHPVHIYITAIFVKFFGLSDFTARLPSALIGVLAVVIIFWLGRILFKNDIAALLSALFLAISPYHIHFSRGLWEVNFAFFFFLLGLLLFFVAIEKKSWFINLSFLSFGLSMLSYHSSKVVVPIIVLTLTILYFKQFKKSLPNIFSSIAISLIFISLLVIDPRLLGIARAQQTQFNKEDLEKSFIYQKTNNSNLAFGEITVKNYLSHFSPQYLFLTGDQSPRNSTKTQGQFYMIDAVFLLIGVLYLLKMRSKVSLVILAWLLLAPLPASLIKGAPSATRALFMMGSLHLISALGATILLGWFKNRAQKIVIAVILVILSFQVYSYLNYYHNTYSEKEPTDWQYGMKQIVEFVEDHDEYSMVYMTEERSQPYIFFLFYLKEPLPDFIGSANYNRFESPSYKYNTVSSFGKYYFGGSDFIEIQPESNILYILTPSQYDGLKHRSEFDVKKIISYPDGSNAFYLVTALK